MTDIDGRPAKVIPLPYAETETEEAPAPAVDMSKPAHDELVEGTVVTAAERELVEDPEGDKPWINPALKTPEGRKARAEYLQRASRRRIRRWLARQRTPRGVLQATVRGGVRIHRWTRGVEGHNAEAARERAELMARESSRATRAARFALMQRDQKKTAAQLAQQEMQIAVTQAVAARKAAGKKLAQRAAAVYGPLAGIDVAGVVVMDGLAGLAAGVLVNLAVLARVGRRPDMDPEELEALEREETGIPERFEIGMTPRMFEQMMRQALTEDLKVNLSGMRVSPQPWGFEVQVWLERMTPEKISTGLDTLEACLPGVRTGSILLQQSASSRNEAVIRVPGEDPWQAVPELPYRGPQSLSTAQIHTAQIGADMSGRRLALPMCRTNVNIVGKSRSGKSTLLRAILDALTATDDQIVIGIDLGSAGSGFGGLRRGMHVVATTPAEAHAALQWALDIGKGRPSLFDRLGMGLNWETSRNRPGIKVVVDEFPALVRESKKGYIDDEGRKVSWDLDGMLAELANTSAKSDVTLVIAGQGVTRERIGGNTWVVELGVQVLAACDNDDVVQILGGGAMAQGWRPDRLLPAMGDQVNDASVAYVLAGSAYTEPIPYRACITSEEELLRRGSEREAGLVDIDPESAVFSPIRLETLMEFGADQAPEYGDRPAPVLLQEIRELYAAAGNPSGLTEDELFDALVGQDPETWEQSQFLEEDGEQMAKGDILALVLDKVLSPRGQRWTKEKYRPRGSSSTARGYRLKDLKILLGEADES